MHRRNFIKNTLLATGALPVALFDIQTTVASEMSVDQSPQSGFQKSIMWGTVGMQGAVLEKCKAIKEAGFDGIEPDSHMDRQEVLDAMQATGLKASSL